MIKPTIGRVVLYRPASGEQIVASFDGTVPALICCVHSDRCINIGGFDANGAPFAKTSVHLHQDGDELPEWRNGGGYAHWVPYQVGQAKAASGS